MKLAFIACAILAPVSVQAAIVYSEAPEGVRDAIRKYVNRELGSDTGPLGGFKVEDLVIGQPFRDYYVGTPNIAAGEFLSRAKPKDWTYPLRHGTSLVAAATLTTDKKGAPVC